MSPRRWLAYLFLWLPIVAVAVGIPVAEASICGAGEWAYRFTNRCAEPIWMGQRSTKDPASHPPKFGGWTLATSCTSNDQCPSQLCDRNSGQCTCKSAAECPGAAACLADGKCTTGSVFCMPQSWASGVFWPRTGCIADTRTSPVQLPCKTGACFDVAGKPLLDCSVDNGGGSPTNPVTQFEVTSVAPPANGNGSINYDVSLAAGYNVETRVTLLGGAQEVPGVPSTDLFACYDVGCGADLNVSCPSALQVKEDGAVIGCLDPCTRCQRADPPASLKCHTELPETWHCDGKSGSVTYLDLYCAKNTADGIPQASPNQGTPTAFGPRDCPPKTTFVRPTFASGYALPAGAGVCLYTDPPQSAIPHFNDYKWKNAAGVEKFCGGSPPDYTPLPNGTACGGYTTAQTGGGSFPDAMGYTCQEATYDGAKTARLCMPPTTTGLGTCTYDSKHELPLFSAGAGVANASWIEAGKAAGNGVEPYYVTFKAACAAAYSWQYDDIASGFSCIPNWKTSAPHATEFQSFDVVFCGSRTDQTQLHGRADRVAGLEARGHAGGIEQPGRGRVRIVGRTALPVEVALSEATVVLTDLLDEVGEAGELVDGGTWTLAPSKSGGAKKAVFVSPEGTSPRVKVVLRRPRAGAEQVKVSVAVRKATIARPAACDDPTGHAKLETGLSIGVGADHTRIGTIVSWRCGKKALRGG